MRGERIPETMPAMQPQRALSTLGKAKSPPSPLGAFLDQAVLEYRDKFYEKIFRKQVNKPWMKYREIHILEELLRALAPLRALEWGVGFGTSHFAGLLPPGGEWISIEHDSAWVDRIRPNLPGNVNVYAVPPDNPAWSSESRDGTYGDFRTYVDAPARFGEYDFILVDGRARAACLHRARNLLAEGGVVVLHDANRDFLREPWDLYPCQTFFRDYRLYAGGLWIGSADRETDSLVDIRKHRNVWRIYNSLGRRFRL